VKNSHLSNCNFVQNLPKFADFSASLQNAFALAAKMYKKYPVYLLRAEKLIHPEKGGDFC